MLEVVLPVAILAILLMFVDQVRRLISHAILNRAIRKAMEIDRASAPLLIAKLESRRRWPDALAGWLLLLFGITIAVATLFATPEDQIAGYQIAAILGVLGFGVLGFSWFVQRSAPNE